MPVSITIRGVPEETRDELAARAARSGRSLQEYLRIQLVEMTSRRDPESLFARIRDRKEWTGTRMTIAEILEHRDAERR
ncbi:MAG TPA: hypothetical protein VIW24_23755 [Aldersonia sp.]